MSFFYIKANLQPFQVLNLNGICAKIDIQIITLLEAKNV